MVYRITSLLEKGIVKIGHDPHGIKGHAQGMKIIFDTSDNPWFRKIVEVLQKKPTEDQKEEGVSEEEISITDSENPVAKIKGFLEKERNEDGVSITIESRTINISWKPAKTDFKWITYGLQRDGIFTEGEITNIKRDILRNPRSGLGDTDGGSGGLTFTQAAGAGGRGT